MPSSLDPDHARCFVGPDPGLNCLQRYSEEDTSKERVYDDNLSLVSWREIANYGYTLNLKSIKYLPAKAISLINFVNSRRQVQVKMLGIIWIHTV